MLTSSAEHEVTTALRVRELTAGYGGNSILHGISIQLKKGEIAAVIGPNGAGKSTLLKAIMGVITCTQGSVHLGDKEVTGLRTDQLARQGLGYVPQVRDVFDPLTVQENLEMGGYLVPKKEVPERIDEVIELFPALVPLARRRAGNLSGGERKMLAMARVLMGRPSVLLLDEPTAGLSPKLADLLLAEHVTQLSRIGVAVLLVEQRAVAALLISGWGYVMVAGAVEVSGPAADLSEREEIGDLFLGGSASGSREHG